MTALEVEAIGWGLSFSSRRFDTDFEFERVVDLEAGITKTPNCGAGHSRKRLKMREYTYRQERGIGDNSVGRG